MRRRVLVVAPQPFYEDRGTPIAIRQVLEALSQLRYDVDVLTFPVGRAVDIPHVRLHRAGNPFRIRSVPIGFSLRKLVLDVSLVAKLTKLLRREKYSCIHAVEEAAFPVVFLARRLGIPVIYDMQSSLPEQLRQYPVFRVRPVYAMLRLCERWLLSKVDVVISSSGLAHDVRATAPATDVREWSFSSDCAPSDNTAVAQLRERLRLPPSARAVVYTGTFEPYQGLSALIEAVPAVCARVPNVVFVLVGGTAEDRTILSHRAKELGLNGNLRIVEQQPREQIPNYLALAEVLVSPRTYGGNLPLKIFDYMAAGKPIVATDIPTHRSVLTDDRAMLVQPGSGGIAAGITELLTDRDGAERRAAAAQSYAEEHLGWSAFVRTVGDIYRKVDNRA